MHPNTNFSWRKASAACRLLNTKEFCFLCLASTQIKIEERNGNSSDFIFRQSFIKRPVSLRCLRRHLQINGILFGDTEILTKLEEEEVEANLCLDCEKRVNRFSTLFLQWEKIQMEMDYQLNQLHLRILNGANNVELVQQYSKEMTSDLETLTQLAWIDKLRKEISLKCSKSRGSAVPTINLQRIETDAVPQAILVKIEVKEDSVPEVQSEFVPPAFPCPPEPIVANLDQPLDCSNSETEQLCSSLQTLFERNSKTEMVHCPSCNKVFSTGFSARIHYKNMHQGKKWKCDICNIAAFYHNGSLTRHRQRCTKISQMRRDKEKARMRFKFPCPACGKKFPTKRNLQQHQIAVHSNSEFRCDRCSKTFKTCKILKDHKSSVHLGKLFHCEYCKKEFRYRQSRNLHQKTCLQKPEQIKEVKLEQSPASIQSVSRGLTDPVPCPSCSKTFTFPAQARYHYASVHLKQKFKCDLCKIAEFSYKASLNRHKKTCLDTLEQRLNAQKQQNSYQFQCLTCEKKFRTLYHLRAHKRYAHTTIRKFRCDLCEKSFKTGKVLKEHKDSAHLKITFPCKFCIKIFNHRGSLRKHLKICQANRTNIKLEANQELVKETAVVQPADPLLLT